MKTPTPKERRAELLLLHVQNRWTPKQFAEAGGFDYDYALRILQGLSWKHDARPEGFVHPWPEATRRKISPEHLAEAFRRHAAENWSVRQFSRFLGLSGQGGWMIFHGYHYKDFERPKNGDPMPYVKIDDAWKRECLEDYVRERMTPHEFAEHVGMRKAHVYGILNGKAWRTTERPPGFQYPWPEREALGSRNRFRRRVAEYDAAVREYESQGWTIQQLADRLGVRRSGAREIMARTLLWRERGY